MSSAPPSSPQRIAKFLARAGVGSRREMERWIEQGRVTLNGRVLDTPAVLVGADDVVTVDGRAVAAPEMTRLWCYHKPAGLLVTRYDPEGRPTIYDELPERLGNAITVGRLDLASEGLLLLTNDGELARHLEHPSNLYRRTYRARAFGRLDWPALDQITKGMEVDGVFYAPAELMVDQQQIAPHALTNHWMTLVLTEGKNREVRRLLEACGLAVNRLIRTSYGPYALEDLPRGAWREVGLEHFRSSP